MPDCELPLPGAITEYTYHEEGRMSENQQEQKEATRMGRRSSTNLSVKRKESLP
jgi:YD repeat-containing protein